MSFNANSFLYFPLGPTVHNMGIFHNFKIGKAKVGFVLPIIKGVVVLFLIDFPGQERYNIIPHEDTIILLFI